MSATRPRLRAEERRRAVLEAASRVFAKSSYDGATTAEIAREAGITEPILYRHFGSKRELYLACLDAAWQSLRATAEEAVAADPGRCLGAVADVYMTRRAQTRLVDLWIQALTIAPEDPAIAKAVKEQVRAVHAFFADVIRAGQAEGHVAAERDPVAEAWVFLGCGLLATMDERLGGLLGRDLERVRTARRAWMLAQP
ncbi:MAG: TetR/AcrR family transcriptional regulator [Actinobacteria bacterium]|nr:TetR/AcrR family transcriptional regulator [Actinomycetota bacterium]